MAEPLPLFEVGESVEECISPAIVFQVRPESPSSTEVRFGYWFLHEKLTNFSELFRAPLLPPSFLLFCVLGCRVLLIQLFIKVVQPSLAVPKLLAVCEPTEGLRDLARKLQIEYKAEKYQDCGTLSQLTFRPLYSSDTHS